MVKHLFKEYLVGDIIDMDEKHEAFLSCKEKIDQVKIGVAYLVERLLFAKQ